MPFEQLEIDKCPHCSRHKPLLNAIHPRIDSRAHDGSDASMRSWRAFICKSCGGAIIAGWTQASLAQARGYINPSEVYPSSQVAISEHIPEKARALLLQTQDSLHAPAGAVMLAAAAVDDMIKQKGLQTGSLYSRIDQAATEHLITDGMKTWAHQIRLDANDQRHADVNAGLPTPTDAKRSFDFAMALAEFLYVLPARVTRGIEGKSS